MTALRIIFVRFDVLFIVANYFKEARLVRMRLLYRIRGCDHIQPPPKKARRGMSLIEAIIALIVVFVALSAILVVVAQSTQMIASTREDLGSFTLITNWFEALETQTTESLTDDPESSTGNFETAVQNVALALDPNAAGSGVEYVIDGYTVTADRNEPEDGVITVSITVVRAGGAKRYPTQFTKTFNTISNATVSNSLARANRGDD